MHFYAAALLFSLSALPAPALASTPFSASAELIEAGHITEARRALEAELRLRPKHVEARYNLAVLLQKIGHNQEAATRYRQNMDYAWHLPTIVNLAAILQQQGKTEQAKALLLQATKKRAYEATPWYLLAAIAENEDMLDKAERQYRKAVTTDPLNGFAHLRLASFLSRHKRGDLGMKNGARATRLLPECAPCWRQYGDMLRATSKAQAARIAYQRSLAIKPDPNTRQQLIDTLEELGEHQRAARMQHALNTLQKHRGSGP
ncbi:MAG: tetratricopeptide repeat protein [Mariprofundus sp.]